MLTRRVLRCWCGATVVVAVGSIGTDRRVQVLLPRVTPPVYVVPRKWALVKTAPAKSVGPGQPFWHTSDLTEVVPQTEVVPGKLSIVLVATITASLSYSVARRRGVLGRSMNRCDLEEPPRRRFSSLAREALRRGTSSFESLGPRPRSSQRCAARSWIAPSPPRSWAPEARGSWAR